ncbi:MAG: 5'/3'-nucleotidase SurE [Planctomycetota bacterium]
MLVTNDDGIDASGIQAMVDSIPQALQIVVVAPDQQRSECGHSVTTRVPIHANPVAFGDDRVNEAWAVSGTPADCVRFALRNAAMPRFDLVCSGINAGANVGTDIVLSGTVAAAREAALRGVPSLAISHYRHPNVPRTWGHCAAWMRPVFDAFFQQVIRGEELESADGNFSESSAAIDGSVGATPMWNVNFPAVDPDGPLPALRYVPVDPTPSDLNCVRSDDGVLSFASDFHGRPRLPGHDICECFSGSLTISRLGCVPG